MAAFLAKIKKRMCKTSEHKANKTDGTRSFFLSRITFCICFGISIILLVAGFFVPPTGVIDGSILTAVGELLLFPTLLYAFRAMELGMKVKVQKGDTSISIEDEEEGRL